MCFGERPHGWAVSDLRPLSLSSRHDTEFLAIQEVPVAATEPQTLTSTNSTTTNSDQTCPVRSAYVGFIPNFLIL